MASTPKPKRPQARKPRRPGAAAPPPPVPVAGGPPWAVVNDRGAERVRGGHLWIYASDILGFEPAPPPPEATAPVRVRDRRGRELGLADWSPQSQIRLRLLSRGAGDTADGAWLRQRLEAALAYRRRVVRESDAYRLVSAEADGLPGLIVDRYGAALSLQALTWGMAARQDAIVALLERLLTPQVIVERNDVKVREREGLPLRSGMLRGESARAEVAIHGLRFALDLLEGQKTGAFLDQRENWLAAAQWARAFQVESALDVFCYQGGFALHLARACKRVEAVDSSRPALEAADANAARNGLENIDWVEANAFDLLKHYDQGGNQFDMVVLDPPAFAKSRSALEAAIGGYKEINLRALKMLKPGGLLISCSCSHHLAESELLGLMAAAAADARRPLTILERRGQALDHPVLLAVPESAYLKCVVAVAR
ncbi:MAG TPA: class I SAM-dependent rRNA methyltransferase [Terriglobales bacterium]|nr:class I SAM-dependent rRNA methyltransferase [Terriglobales bacterium]